MGDLKQMLIDSPRTAADVELDELTNDADRETRRRLGEQYAPVLAAATQRYEWLGDPGERAPRGAAFALQTVTEVVAELCNGAQREVPYRASLIGAGKLDDLAALEAPLDAADETTAAEATDVGDASEAAEPARTSGASDHDGVCDDRCHLSPALAEDMLSCTGGQIIGVASPPAVVNRSQVGKGHPSGLRFCWSRDPTQGNS